jgi:hypothetical protein
MAELVKKCQKLLALFGMCLTALIFGTFFAARLLFLARHQALSGQLWLWEWDPNPWSLFDLKILTEIAIRMKHPGDRNSGGINQVACYLEPADCGVKWSSRLDV